jgi:SAM-dependent methyltransferase
VPTYALLVLPTHNRVYGRAALEMGLAELASLDRLLLGGRLGPAETVTMAGRPYHRLSCAEIDAEAASVIASLSNVYAAFELAGGALRPLELPAVDMLSDDLVTIQRYQGKTNEHLTRLMLNLALAATGCGPGSRATVLDPACGRGTTLNHALLRGLDAVGMEIEKAAVDAYALFLRTWLQEHRLKHRLAYRPERRDGRTVAHVLEAEFSASRQELERGRPQRVRVVATDSTRAAAHLRPGSADALVVDLPYGVQHAGRTAGRAQRGAEALLEAALPAWLEVLRPGSGACLSWNTRTLARPRLVALARGAGLEVLDGPPFDGFAHRVDQAITRDVLVARRP